jgi:hypothetical protein
MNLELLPCFTLNLEGSFPHQGEHVVHCTHGRDVRPYKNTVWYVFL